MPTDDFDFGQVPQPDELDFEDLLDSHGDMTGSFTMGDSGILNGKQDGTTGQTGQPPLPVSACLRHKVGQ